MEDFPQDRFDQAAARKSFAALPLPMKLLFGFVAGCAVLALIAVAL